MYQISRIHFSSVGPEAARFDPLRLDLRLPDGTIAPETLLWLENGGGKTVLLRLLFTVLRPDQVAHFGTEDTGKVKGFPASVLADDVAHIVVEWRRLDSRLLVDTEVLLTGLVAEWRGHSRSPDTGNLLRTWYSVRSSDGAFTLDSLPPPTLDGRRLSRAAYLERLRELAKPASGGRARLLDLKWTDVQKQWLAHLDALGLDTVLFTYQIHMNHDESGASKIFKFFANDQEFLEFLLNLVTEPTSIASLDQSLAELAEKVATRPRHELELEYATGLINHLEQIVSARTRLKAAKRGLGEAVSEARLLRDRFNASRQLAANRAAAASDTVERESANAREHDQRRRVLDDERREFLRLAAEFALAEASEQLQIAQRAEAAAKLLAAAWREVDRVDAYRTADAAVHATEAAYAAAERDAAGLRAERDSAALRLLRRLQAEIVIQLAEEEREESDARRLEAEASRHANETREALLEANNARHEREVLQRQLADVRARREAIVSRGTMSALETTDEALARWRTHSDALVRELEAVVAQREAIRTEQAELARVTEHAEPERAIAFGEATSLDRDLRAAGEWRGQLTAHPRLQQLAETADFDLELIGPALAGRLLADAIENERRLIALEIRGADDRRAEAGLSESEFLPPPVALDLILDHLHAAGVQRAMTGWRYLAESIPSKDWDVVVLRRPDLVSGIVLTNAEDLPRAQAVLLDAGLDPTLAIVVGTAEELVSAEAEGVPRVVVPPARALFDRQAAAAELVRRRERLETLNAERRSLDDKIRSDRQLAEDINRHLAAYPSGTLAAQAQRLQAVRERVERLEREIGAARARQQTLTAELRALEAREPELHRAQRNCDRALADLTSLRDAESTTSGAEKRTQELAQVERDWTRLAETANEDETRVRAAARAARDRAADRRAAADRTERDAIQVPLAERPTPLTKAEAIEVVARLGDIAALRAAFVGLEDVLVRRTSGSELKRRLDQSIRTRDELRADLRALSPEVYAEAERLLDSPEGIDPPSRRRAAARGQEALEQAIATRARREADHEKAGHAAQDASPKDGRARFIQLPPERVPGDRLTAERRAAENALAYQHESDARALADEAVANAKRAVEAAKSDEERFKGFATAIRQSLETVDSAADDLVVRPAPSFEGDALADFEATTERLQQADRESRGAAAETRNKLDDLLVFARAERFATLSAGQLHRRLAHEAPDMLLQESPSLLVNVRTLAERLREELATLQQHRTLVVQSMASLTGAALSNLRTTERQSRLPAGSGPWSEQAFLRIRFEQPTSTVELESRLTTLVADLASMEGARRPTGARLLMNAVSAAVVGGFKVLVLKPNPAGDIIYVPIAELGGLSGGMRATAAIALFCTLARLRAHNRSRAREMGVATLCLDNPLGTANAPYLVDLQLNMAHAAGIQLLYTTGIQDYSALRPFSNLIALSNDGARRTTLRYVRTDPRLLERLAPPRGDGARVHATRVIARP